MPRPRSRVDTVGLSLAILLLFGPALLTLRRGLWREGLLDGAMAAGVLGLSGRLLRLCRASDRRGRVAQASVPGSHTLARGRGAAPGTCWGRSDRHTGRCLPLEEGDLFSIVAHACVPDESEGTSRGEER